MKVLVVPPPEASHLTAMVQACWALRATGHEVLVACQPDLVPVARNAGLNAAEIGQEAQLTEHARRYTSPDWYPAEAFGQRDTEAGRFLWEVTAQTYVQHAISNLQRYLRLARSWGPDLLLVDPFAVIGRVLGGILNIPVVSHRWGVDPTSGLFETMVHRMLTRLLNRHKLGALPAPVVLLDPCPPSIQVLDAPLGQPVRFAPYDGAGVLPEWVTEHPGRRRVAVCMGPSVLSLTGPRPVHRVLDALSGVADTEVVVTLSAKHRGLIGEVAANVRLAESLPLNLFLDTCDLLIHHGGSSAGLTAAAYGIPQLVLPQYADQFDYGSRLTESGAGLDVPDAASQSDVDGLRAAIEGLLDERSFRSRAERLRMEIESAPTLDAVVPSLEALIAGRQQLAVKID